MTMATLELDPALEQIVTAYNAGWSADQVEAYLLEQYPDSADRAIAIERWIDLYDDAVGAAQERAGMVVPRRLVFHRLDTMRKTVSLPPSWQPIQGDLDLTLIHPALREMAVADLAAGNVGGFLCRARGGNQFWLRILRDNFDTVRCRGLYEPGLLAGYVCGAMNNAAWSMAALRDLFDVADRGRLRAAGDPLPEGPWPRTVYRGVAGSGTRRRVRGFSWTADLERAEWFAKRAGGVGLDDPAVYQTSLREADVLVYTNDRKEQEYIILPPRPKSVTRVD